VNYIKYDPSKPDLMERVETLWRETTVVSGADKIVDDWKRGACQLIIEENTDEIISSNTDGGG